MRQPAVNGVLFCRQSLYCFSGVPTKQNWSARHLSMAVRLGSARRLSTLADAPFLARRAANHVPLTPLHLLARTADIYPARPAIVYADWAAGGPFGRPPAVVQTWAQTAERVTHLAEGLRSRFCVGRGDVVAVLSPNTPGALPFPMGSRLGGGGRGEIPDLKGTIPAGRAG
jgi:hypothetical protein